MNTIGWKKYKRVLDIIARMWLAIIVLCVHVGVSYMWWYFFGFALWAWTAAVAVVAITTWAFNWTFDNYDYEDRFDDYVLDKAEQKRWVEHAWKCLNKRNEKDQ